MVKHKGLCPSLKKSVEFDVNEVIELKTKRGTKYQVKGDYEGRTCSTFCSKAKAMELKSALGQTIMSAETEDETGQAHQDESVAPMDNNVQPLSQGQEPMADMPVQETVATPITGTSVGVEAIDNLQLNDADALTNMATQFDDAPDMVADFEIAPQEPEGDGRSIGNIRPMNEDVPLHAESEDGTGQAHQEEGVSPIETDVQPLAQGQEPMENMPVQETVATPITNSSVGVEAIDNLQLNDADALTNMATQFDDAPEMLANFEISFMQPFGDGQSIGNNTPMNPDVPLHAETVESPIQTVNPMDETTLTTPPPVCFVEKIPPVVWEDMSVLEQIEYAETGNEGLLSCPQCGITKADLRDAGGYCAISDPEGSEYNSSVDCPYQKHFAPSHWLDEEYVVGHVEGDIVEVSERLPARVDMPKMKNPQRGLEEMLVPYFIWDKIYTQFNGGITAEPDLSGLNYTLQFHGMMKPKIKNLIKGAEGNHDIMFGSETYNATVLKAEGDGGYFIDSTTVSPYGAESFEAKDNNSRREWTFLWKPASDGYGNSVYASSLEGAKKEVLRQYPQGSSMYGRADLSTITDDATVNKRRWRDWDLQWNAEEFDAESFEAEKCICKNYTPDFNRQKKMDASWSKIGQIESYEWDDEDDEQAVIVPITCDDCGRKGETVYSHGYNEYDDSNLKWFGAEEVAIAVEKTRGGDTLYGVEYLDLGYEHTEWFMSKTDRDLHLDMYVEEFDAETFEAEQCMVCSKPPVLRTQWGHTVCGDDDCRKRAMRMINMEDVVCDCEGTMKPIGDGYYECKSCYDTQYIGDVEFGAETFEAEQCKHEEYYVIGMDGDEWNEGGENFAMLEIECESCGVRGKGETNLSYDTAPNREHNRIWWEDIGFEAETFGVEFDDWADQEMLTHGKMVSFKKWAKEEGKKHGDMDLTDWAEHEEESHDERYGAENFEVETLDSSTTQDKPSLKSVGLLLGVGALATYFAPKGMREFFNRLK